MSAPTLQDGFLTWGVLEFVGPGESESLFDIEAMADGTNTGNPQPVIEVVRSLLIDGALAAVTGWDNREIPIRLRISANDGEAMAEAEAALVQQCLMDQPYPLQWTPPVGDSATCVFDTVVARLDQDTSDGWDTEAIRRGHRYYLLTLTCLPFARAVEATVVPALPVPADPDTEDWTDVDTCGSTTGWTLETNGGSPAGPVVSAGVAVAASAHIDNANDYLRLVRTGAIVVPTDYYLVVDASISKGSFGIGWGPGQWRARVDGVYHDPIAITQDGEGGSDRLFFSGITAVTELAILQDFAAGGTAGTTTLKVYNVATTDTLGASSTTTNRQQSRLVTVAGSTPTQAAIRLYDATPADLGTDIVIYTTRNTEWRPNLRRWIDTSDAPTADAAMVSGAWHDLATDTVFLLPADLLRLGTYALTARMDINVAGTLSWSARMVTSGGAATVGSDVVVSGEIDLAVTSGYEVVNLAAMVLPVVEVESSNYAVELTVSGTADMSLDEAWLFSLDDGALTWINDTEGLDWIEIRSPELGAARPSVWGGRNGVGVGGSCIDWKCRSFGSHRFDPGTMQIFTMDTDSLISQCEIEFFPRFHSHVWGQETS